MEPFPAQARLTPTRVLIVRVAPIDDDVAVGQQGDELVDHRVGAGARLDHDDDPARLFQARHEVAELLGGKEFALVGMGLHDVFGAGVRAVVDGRRDAVAREIAGQVRAHHGHADDADPGLGGCRHDQPLSKGSHCPRGAFGVGTRGLLRASPLFRAVSGALGCDHAAAPALAER